MRLYPEEPEVTSWTPLDDIQLVDRLHAKLPAGERTVIVVDGRSGGGKSTFARRVALLLNGAVVHSDDLAWRHHPTHWADLLVDGVISPWRRGQAVAFRPPAWDSHNRPGAVEVSASTVLVVEGVGAGRADLAAEAALAVWVQSDRDEARRRGLERDATLGRSRDAAEQFWDEWMRAEEPFFAADRPWSRAALIVNGTPPRGAGGRTLVARGPLRR